MRGNGRIPIHRLRRQSGVGGREAMDRLVRVVCILSTEYQQITGHMSLVYVDTITFYSTRRTFQRAVISMEKRSDQTCSNPWWITRDGEATSSSDETSFVAWSYQIY